MRYFDRDLSWLQFNERVLLEAQKESVPLYERILFLSIFSSNLDEFFKVRYPALKIAARANDTTILASVQELVRTQQNIYGTILREQILPQLRERKVHLYYNENLSAEHQKFATDFFYTQALSFLQPVILTATEQTVPLQNNGLYFIVVLHNTTETRYALVNIPQEHLSRFILAPKSGAVHVILFLDDIIRANVAKIFPGYTVSECYSIKMTRSADVDIIDENSDLFEEHLLEMISEREKSTPTRMLYESGMPEVLIDFVARYFDIEKDSMIAGGRYHNLKDLARLPNPLGDTVRYPAQTPLLHASLSVFDSIFDAIDSGDHLLHFPYHTYSYILRFFNEAAIDPFVSEISVTLYRVATDSFITNALISAAKNGKKVTAFIELKARFDESNNLNWAKKMKAAGVKIIYSIPGIKVHAKLALVKRKQHFKSTYYSLISTGNFNEQTAKFYTDHILLTKDAQLTKEIDLLFAFLAARQHPKAYSFLDFPDLMVAGFNFLDKLSKFIDREMTHQQNGRKAHITIKLNNLEEKEAIELLYQASNAGVKVDLIVRGICCLKPGVKGMSEHITVRKIIGRYLEHSRVYIFENDGNKEIFIGSADLMTRNIRRRIEVLVPVYNKARQQELLDITALQLADNVQAVNIDKDGEILLPGIGNIEINSQAQIYNYIQNL
ncbi:MAG TPA: polyphosphate kinase 1 [Chitinophagaceae bacterium]|nr:polyphosphate kinase 1 [Chitinophagaceae bacterium]